MFHVLVLILSFLTTTAYASDRVPLTPEEKKFLETHTIRLAPDPDFMPFEAFDNEGKYVGMAADYIELIRKIIPINIEIVQMDTWKQVVNNSKLRYLDMWGMGIEKKYLDTVFEPFVRSEEVQKKAIEGTGLGLSLVKQMVELHGGNVEITSDHGIGTQVIIKFPLERIVK